MLKLGEKRSITKNKTALLQGKARSRGGHIFFGSPFPLFQRDQQDTSVWVILTLFLLYWLSQSRSHSLFSWPY